MGVELGLCVLVFLCGIYKWIFLMGDFFFILWEVKFEFFMVFKLLISDLYGKKNGLKLGLLLLVVFIFYEVVGGFFGVEDLV